MDYKGTKFLHLRYKAYNLTSQRMEPAAKGGTTLAYRVEGNTIIYGIAFCNKSDNYMKRIGRAKAYGRMQSKNHPNYFEFETKPSSNTCIEYLLSIFKEPTML